MLVPVLIVAVLLQPSPQREYEQAVALLQKGQTVEAIALLDKTLHDHSSSAPLWRLLGVAQAQHGNLPAAVDSFAKACDLNASLPDACYYLGRALYSVNRFEEALDPLKKAIRVDAVKARSETALAECYEGMGQAQEAEEFFRWAVARKDRAYERATLAYARFLIRAGRTGESVGLLRESLEANPNSPEANYQMARVLQQLDKVEEALPFAEKAVARKGDVPQYRLMLARLYRRAGRVADAEREEKLAQGSSTVRN